MISAVLIDEADHVVTVTKQIEAGEEVIYISNGNEISVKALQPIPIYHKIAVREVNAGGDVIKYGEIIGSATKTISVGEHVHTQNVDSKKED